MLTTAQAAALLSLAPDTVKRHCQRGVIKAEKIGRDWLIPEEEVTRYRAARHGPGRPTQKPQDLRQSDSMMVAKEEATMTFQEAIQALAQGRGIDPEPEWDATIDEARHVVAVEVASLCKTDTDGIGDWISAGDYSGSETAESIAVEWDSLSA